MKQLIPSTSKIVVSDLDELLKAINDGFADWPNYIFRGQAQSDWLLESTLSRSLKKFKSTTKSKLVKEHLEKFKLEIRGRRGANPRQLSDDELWALGQHYGLSTPLLDWTQSPYVALFFALIRNEPSPTGYRTLWGIHSTDLTEISKWYKKYNPQKAKKEVSLLNPILDENNRLVSQNGLFTKLDIDIDLETWVYEAPSLGWQTLYKIDFSEKIRDEALTYLNLMNINYSSLFPDIFGSSMNCNISLEQTDYFKKRQDKHWSN